MEEPYDMRKSLILSIALVCTVAGPSGAAVSKCDAGKLKALGKEVAALLKCYAAAPTGSGSVDPACIAAASAKFEASLAKLAEKNAGCSASGDMDALDLAAKDFAAQSGSQIAPAPAAADCVDIINDYRASVGLTALARWSDSETCADGEAATDAAAGTPHSAFGTCAESAQNECPGWGGAPREMIDDCLAGQWAEGPGDFETHSHYLNLTGNWTKVACGFSYDGSTTWAVINFQ
jgi:hypothetical protein